MNANQKLEILKTNIKYMGSLAVAFSGGVDSTFLLAVAHQVLGDKVAAVTARSATFPRRESREAADFTRSLGIRHLLVTSDELDIDAFSDNPPNRCYLCKKVIFSKVRQMAAENGLKFVADGSNLDDLKDYRPGLMALKELGIISPLKDAGLSKSEIRMLSKNMNLATWDKPAYACLATRFPYGEKITPEKISMVEKAEDYLWGLGFQQIRVRHHGALARIEVQPEERQKFFDQLLMDKVSQFFQSIGFTYTALDLAGYRMGSMNETLDPVISD